MSKQTDLEALAAGVLYHQHDDIPTGGTPGNTESGTWNVNPGILNDALAMLGGFFTGTDDAHDALATKYDANHNPDGSHAPPAEWIPEPNAPTFLAAQQFSLVGDRTADYRSGDRIRLHQGAGGTTLVVVAITSAGYESGPNRTVLIVRTATSTGPVANSLVAIDRGLIRDSAPRIGGFDLRDAGVDRSDIIADRIILNRMLGPNCVGRGEIADGEVLTAKLANLGVTEPKIANASIPNRAYQAASITEDKLADQAVTAGKIAAGAVGQTQLATGAVTEAKLAGGAVENAKLATNAVTAVKIAANAVETAKIADRAVTPAKRALEHYQTPSGNAQVEVVRQSGWHYLDVGSDTERFWSRAITFPVAFTALRALRLQCTGLKRGGAAPASPFNTDVTLSNSNWENTIVMQPQTGGSTSLTGFVAVAVPNAPTDTMVTGDRIVFTWEAEGTI